MLLYLIFGANVINDFVHMRHASLPVQTLNYLRNYTCKFSGRKLCNKHEYRISQPLLKGLLTCKHHLQVILHFNMESSCKKVTKDLDLVLQLNDTLFSNFTPAKMLQGDNISQLSTFITEMLCKPQMYKKKLMVNTLNCLLCSWEEDISVRELLEDCATFLSTAGDGQEVFQSLRCDDGDDDFCLFATALLNLCRCGILKAEVTNNVVKAILNFKDSDIRSQLMRSVWSQKETLGLPIETLEDLVLRQPILVEEVLMDVALVVARAAAEECEDLFGVVLAQPAIASLLDVCRRSPLVFQMVTSMLHSLVCRAPLNTNLLRLSQEVFTAVSKAHGPLGVASLLPAQQQALALWLQVDPELLPDDLADARQLYAFTLGATKRLSKGYVLQLIAAGLVTDPAATSALLVYYPQWMKQLFTLTQSM